MLWEQTMSRLIEITSLVGQKAVAIAVPHFDRRRLPNVTGLAKGRSLARPMPSRRRHLAPPMSMQELDLDTHHSPDTAKFAQRRARSEPGTLSVVPNDSQDLRIRKPD